MNKLNKDNHEFKEILKRKETTYILIGVLFLISLWLGYSIGLRIW